MNHETNLNYALHQYKSQELRTVAEQKRIAQVLQQASPSSDARNSVSKSPPSS